MKKILYPVLACIALTSSGFAGTDYKGSKEVTAPVPELCFRDQELQLDIFGSYTDDVSNNPHRDGFGGGVALNYFFVRNFGIGADGNVYDGGANGVWDVTGRLIVRFPIDSACIAPYIFGGGGWEANAENFGTVHAGGGLEWRATHTIGIFGEGRYTWGEDDRNSSQARVGVRIVF